MTKRKKIAIIISIVVLVLAGLGVGGFFLARELQRQQDPLLTMSDEEFLVEFGEWTILDGENLVIWKFLADGAGALTTNGGLDEYEMQWTVEGQRLVIETEWLYPMTDEFSFTTDRDGRSFTVVDTAEDKITTFVPYVDEAEAEAEE